MMEKSALFSIKNGAALRALHRRERRRCDTSLRARNYSDVHVVRKISLRRDLSRYVFVKKCAIRIDKQQKERYNNIVIDNDVII